MPSRSFRSRWRRPSMLYSNDRCVEEGSFGSCPLISSRTVAQSSADRAIGPSLSIVNESAIAPVRGTRPYVGRSPVTLQKAAGTVIEPHVSDPIANPTSPSPTAAPEPLLDPPAQRDSSNGHLHVPVME